jgi:hypothetical protein
MSLIVKVFGCRPRADSAADSGGRRPKTSKGGNRGKGYVGGAARYNGALAEAFGHQRSHNFNDLARVLLNGESNFRSSCNFKELGVAKIAHSTTLA